MIVRDITNELKESAAEYPVVTIFGPRQSGKTTLTQMTFPEMEYYSMEDPDIRLAAQADPRGFLSNLRNGCILDEIQRFPDLLSYVQGIVDKENKPGKFILTGSHQPELHQSVSQTLAGRTAVLTLLPFSYNELKGYKQWEPFDLIRFGSYPRVHQEGLKPNRFFNGYVQTYLERDVRALINLKDLRSFQQFFSLLAGRVGQIVNYTSLSNDVGVSATTVKNWINVLKASHIVFELPPFFENIRKRVIKSPKIYFTDTGIVTYLLGIETVAQVKRDPLRGGLYENLIITEILKTRLNAGKRAELFFYRDTHGNEVDLLIKDGRKFTTIEIKSAATFTNSFITGIEKFSRQIGDKYGQGYVFFNGEEQYTIKGIDIVNPFQQDCFGLFK